MTRPAPTTTVRVVTSNVYARNRQHDAYKRSVTKHAPDVICCQEAQRLGRIPGYRRHGGIGRLRGGVATYTRRATTKVDRSWWRQLTVRGAGAYVHPRGVRVVRLVVNGARVAVVNTHANPGRRGDGKRQNARLIRGLGKVIRRLAAQGYPAPVAADFNRTAGDRGPDTPRRLADLTGGRLVMHGIDGFVLPPSVEVTRSRTWRPPGADHDAFALDLAVPSPATYRTTTHPRSSRG